MDSSSLPKSKGRPVPHIPSFNDFGSMASEDAMESGAAPRPILTPVRPGAPRLERSWSVGSDAETPRTPTTPLRPTFSETFSRALYELMRGN